MMEHEMLAAEKQKFEQLVNRTAGTEWEKEVTEAMQSLSESGDEAFEITKTIFMNGKRKAFNIEKVQTALKVLHRVGAEVGIDFPDGEDEDMAREFMKTYLYAMVLG